MKRTRRAVAVVVLLLFAAPPAFAQESAVEVDASIGLQGYVAPYEPTRMNVRVSADVLFVGNLQVVVGGVSLFTPIEVPAGSTKDYVFDVPAVGSNGRAVVRLYPEGSDEYLVQSVVQVLQPDAEPLVGVAGAAAVEPDLLVARSVPFGRSVTVLNLSPEELGEDLAPLSYLVIGDGALSGVGPEVLESVGAWVRGGGRLVGAAEDLRPVAAEAGPAVVLDDGVTVAALGSGELVVVDSITGVNDWSGIVRDVPRETLGTGGFDEGIEFEMIEAASAGGDAVTPGIPWLLAALVGYVLLVGPVNFLILRRLNRRELAWITVPAISLMMMGVLWVAGRAQVADRIVTHASIVVQDDGDSRASSSMIVMAGGEGEHVIDVPEDWRIAPLDLSMMFGNGRGTAAKVGPAPDGGTRMGFELPSLGAAALSAMWHPPAIPLSLDAELDGATVVATVTNDSDLEFWAWGIGSGRSAKAKRGALAPGQTATVKLKPGKRFDRGGGAMAEAALRQVNREWNGPGDPWQITWPLSSAMFRQEAGILADGPFFFGFTNDLEAEVAVDGTSESAHGSALVVVPLDVDTVTGDSNQTGEIVQVVGANFVDAQPGWLHASGAHAIEVRYIVFGAAAKVTLGQSAGRFPAIKTVQVYNWETGLFDDYPWPGDFPVEGHTSATGELMVRIVFADDGNRDLNLPTGALTFTLEAAGD